MKRLIVTSEVSEPLRDRGIDVKRRAVSLSSIADSPQEQDLSEPTNCHGFGRVRHFRHRTSPKWPNNPLPLRPARYHLGDRMSDSAQVRAQVFQNSVCNWRCWYCYVPFSMLKGDPSKSSFVPVSQMVTWYLTLDERPPILDLSGGQPDLVPEWIVWTMEELRAQGAEGDVFLWSDDNLSNDYVFRFLTDEQLSLMSSFRGYGRVGCFKGFDSDSFSFNTGADPEGWDEQFRTFSRLATIGCDLWAYVTLTAPKPDRPDPAGSIRSLVDRLQMIDSSLPLRTVPLEVQVFSPTERRVHDEQRSALSYQHDLVGAWATELEARFTAAERARYLDPMWL